MSSNCCRDNRIDALIRKRLQEFEILGKKGEVNFDFRPFIDIGIKATLKTELSFCLSTANSSAVSSLRFQKLLESSEDTENLGNRDSLRLLKISGVRFHVKKALYISEAMKKISLIENVLRMPSRDAREILVKNFKGLGYKEASHFLRNTGRRDVAITDRHILRWLHEKGYIDEIPCSLTGKRYEKIEDILKKVGKERNLTVGELDLHLWHNVTGKILK